MPSKSHPKLFPCISRSVYFHNSSFSGLQRVLRMSQIFMALFLVYATLLSIASLTVMVSQQVLVVPKLEAPNLRCLKLRYFQELSTDSSSSRPAHLQRVETPIVRPAFHLPLLKSSWATHSPNSISVVLSRDVILLLFLDRR